MKYVKPVSEKLVHAYSTFAALAAPLYTPMGVIFFWYLLLWLVELASNMIKAIFVKSSGSIWDTPDFFPTGE